MLKKFKKKRNPKVLAAIVLFFIALSAIGIFSAMKLMGQKQDDRSQASVAGGAVKVRLAKKAPCVVGKTCVADLFVNTNNTNIDELKLKLMVEGGAGQVSEPVFTTSRSNANTDGRRNAQEGIRYEDNMLNQLMLTTTTKKEDASLQNAIILDWKVSPRGGGVMSQRGSFSFNTGTSELLLGTVEFKINGATRGSRVTATNVSLAIDKTASVALISKTGVDGLDTPPFFTFKINVTEGTACKVDSACADNQYCYQPPSNGRRTTGATNFRAITSYCKTR